VILNPRAEVQTTRGSNGEIDGLRIVAPVRGRGLQRTSIARATDPAGFGRTRRLVLTALFDAQSGGDPWAGASIEARDLFERTGLFLAETAVPGPVRWEYDLSGIHVDTSDVSRQESFAVVRAALPGPLLDALRQYCSDFVAEGYAVDGAPEGQLRWVAHNDAVARALHPFLAPAVSAIVGEAMKPSFSYLVTYLEGAALRPHQDREQCAATAVLQVDFDPRPEGTTPWPLVFNSPGGREEAYLAVGDLIVFRGSAVEHYRDPLTSGRSSTNLAFCFVPADFTGPLD